MTVRGNGAIGPCPPALAAPPSPPVHHTREAPVERVADVPGQRSPAELESENVDVRTNVDPGPGAEPAPPIVPNPGVTKVVVAVHGVGDQYSYATIQSV